MEQPDTVDESGFAATWWKPEAEWETLALDDPALDALGPAINLAPLPSKTNGKDKGPSVVYVMSDGTALKIGCSNLRRMKQRLREVQCGNPRRVRVIGLMAGDRDLEQKLHAQFRAYRCLPDAQLEWFEPAPAVLSVLERLVRSRPVADAETFLQLAATPGGVASTPDSPEEMKRRFWAKVERGPGCWRWQGCCGESGAGRVLHKGRKVPAARVAYEWEVGAVPEGLRVTARCGNVKCVRPDHLAALTPAEIAALHPRRTLLNGERNGRAKLTAQAIREIRRQRGVVKQAVLARRFNTSQSQVSAIQRGELWGGVA